MFVLAAAFAGYFALLLHSDLTRPEPAGFISEIHDSALAFFPAISVMRNERAKRSPPAW
jgi:hypothetical protein